MKEEIKPFVRISWEKAMRILEPVLQDKFGAKGPITLRKDYGCGDGVGDAYEVPSYVDIQIDAN